LRGATLVRTVNSFKQSTEAVRLRATTGAPARVSLLVDTAYTATPGFLGASWRATTDTVRAQSLTFAVYEQYRDADTIEIPGPRAGGGAGNRAAYAVLLSPAEAPCLAVDTREESSCMEFGIGARPYRDADTIRIVESHQVLDQGTLIRTYQADNTRSATGEVTRISLRRSAWVYVMIDIREKTLPKWMQCSDSSGCWELVVGAVRTNQLATYRIYRRFFDAGIMTLGGLATDRNNYFVVVKEPVVVTVDGVDPQYQVPAEPGVNPFYDDNRSIEALPPVLVLVNRISRPK